MLNAPCGDVHPNPGPCSPIIKFVARFTNIRGIRSKFDYLEHDLLATHPGDLAYLYFRFTVLDLLTTPSMMQCLCISTLFKNFTRDQRIIILGDMNAYEKWLGSKKTGIHGVCAFEFAVLNNLHQLVDQCSD